MENLAAWFASQTGVVTPTGARKAARPLLPRALSFQHDFPATGQLMTVIGRDAWWHGLPPAYNDFALPQRNRPSFRRRDRLFLLRPKSTREPIFVAFRLTLQQSLRNSR